MSGLDSGWMPGCVAAQVPLLHARTFLCTRPSRSCWLLPLTDSGSLPLSPSRPLSQLALFPLFPVNSSFSFPSRLSFRLSASLPIRAVALANRGKLKRASEHCSSRLCLASLRLPATRKRERTHSVLRLLAPSRFWSDQSTVFSFPFPPDLCEFA